LCLCGEIRADELSNPYDLRIVVHVAENRLLTDVFRKNIERELRDGFQSALGDMGRVEVTDKHPRLADVVARGLRSLEEWKDRNDQKTHFVLIDYTGTHYQIQTRQYDGAIGLPSPVVRTDRTRDRAFVAKAAALLIKQDFGVLGTVQSGPEGAKEQVKIELRGGALGDMTRWVKKDDVFALAPPDGGTQASLKWSLLQVEQAPTEDARSVCTCRFFHRYVVRGGILGYRCIKLGTVQAPLRLRWMQRQKVRVGFKTRPPDSSLSVEIRRHGFDNEEATKLEKQSDPNGFMDTASDKDGVFNNVAFVRVSSGLGESHLQVPIALVDDQVITIEVPASRDVDSLFTYRLSLWQGSVADSVQMQADLFRRLEILGRKAENRSEVLSAATSGLKQARLDRSKLLEQQKELAEEAKKSGKDLLRTPIEDNRLQQLEKYEKALAQFIEEQKKIEDKENDPQRRKWLSEIQQAKLLEKDLEIDKAIGIYERIRKDGYEDKDGELEKHLAQLHKDWDLRGPEHEAARKFIYRVWPTLDVSRLEDNIKKAQDAFKTCKDAGDSISIEKLLRGTLEHAGQLEKKLAELRPDLVIEDEKEALEFKKVSEQIVKLGLDIQAHLKTLSGK
jgi:hypothetical protein